MTTSNGSPNGTPQRPLAIARCGGAALGENYHQPHTWDGGLRECPGWNLPVWPRSAPPEAAAPSSWVPKLTLYSPPWLDSNGEETTGRYTTSVDEGLPTTYINNKTGQVWRLENGDVTPAKWSIFLKAWSLTRIDGYRWPQADCWVKQPDKPEMIPPPPFAQWNQQPLWFGFGFGAMCLVLFVIMGNIASEDGADYHARAAGFGILFFFLATGFGLLMSWASHAHPKAYQVGVGVVAGAAVGMAAHEVARQHRQHQEEAVRKGVADGIKAASSNRNWWEV